MSETDHLLDNIGHELDELIAIKVFGQERPPWDDHKDNHIDLVINGVWFCLPDYYDGDRCLWEPFHFSLIMEKAWLIIEKMESMGYNPLIEKGRYGPDPELWCASFWKEGDDSQLACASTPAHAVCLAALHEVEKEDE